MFFIVFLTRSITITVFIAKTADTYFLGQLVWILNRLGEPKFESPGGRFEVFNMEWCFSIVGNSLQSLIRSLPSPGGGGIVN